jgi:hypothetical protein
MSTVAVLATFYRRPEVVAPIAAALRAQTRPPDELWLLCETDEDAALLVAQQWPIAPRLVQLDCPRDGSGRPTQNPLAAELNFALDRTQADYVVYLPDDSLPEPRKIEAMAGALDEHPEWGAVYCAIIQTLPAGSKPRLCAANAVVPDAFRLLDMVQVVHRSTPDRWPLDVATLRLCDAYFWRSLHARLGAFYPVPEVLDAHRARPDGISALYGADTELNADARVKRLARRYLVPVLRLPPGRWALGPWRQFKARRTSRK